MSGLRLFLTKQFDAVERFLTIRGHTAAPWLNRMRPTVGLILDLNADTRSLLCALYTDDFNWF